MRRCDDVLYLSIDGGSSDEFSIQLIIKFKINLSIIF